MNQVVLIGRLTRDPELDYVGSEKDRAMCKFTLAVDRGKRKGEDLGADFIPVVCWNSTAEICGQYLAKGRQVAVRGRISVNVSEGDDGSRKYFTNVVADQVEFLGNGGNGGGKQQKDEPAGEDADAEDLEAEDTDVDDTEAHPEREAQPAAEAKTARSQANGKSSFKKTVSKKAPF